jgi:hypothetical protein
MFCHGREVKSETQMARNMREYKRDISPIRGKSKQRGYYLLWREKELRRGAVGSKVPRKSSGAPYKHTSDNVLLIATNSGVKFFFSGVDQNLSLGSTERNFWGERA